MSCCQLCLIKKIAAAVAIGFAVVAISRRQYGAVLALGVAFFAFRVSWRRMAGGSSPTSTPSMAIQPPGNSGLSSVGVPASSATSPGAPPANVLSSNATNTGGTICA